MSGINHPLVHRAGPEDVLTEDEVALFKDYRTAYLPLSRLKASDDFGKWLFGLSTVIGSLGAALSNSSIFKLAGTGRTLFGTALAATSVSFALATVALFIDVGAANPNDPDKMLTKATRNVFIKRVLLVIAVIFLAISLVLAGVAPGLSHDVQKDGISYVLNGANLDVSYMAPASSAGKPVELRVEGDGPGNSKVLLAQVRRIADSAPQQTKLEITKITLSDQVHQVTITASTEPTPVEVQVRAATSAPPKAKNVKTKSARSKKRSK